MLGFGLGNNWSIGSGGLTKNFGWSSMAIMPSQLSTNIMYPGGAEFRSSAFMLKFTFRF